MNSLSAKEVSTQNGHGHAGVRSTVTATYAGEYLCIFYYFPADRTYLMWDGSEMGDDSTPRNVGS